VPLSPFFTNHDVDNLLGNDYGMDDEGNGYGMEGSGSADMAEQTLDESVISCAIDTVHHDTWSGWRYDAMVDEDEDEDGDRDRAGDGNREAGPVEEWGDKLYLGEWATASHGMNESLLGPEINLDKLAQKGMKTYYISTTSINLPYTGILVISFTTVAFISKFQSK
jgi:hypothetical protein